MPPRQRGKGKSPDRKATKELREKADELGVAYTDDVSHDTLAQSLRWWQRQFAWMKWLLLVAGLVTAFYGSYQWAITPAPCDRDCRAENAIMMPRKSPYSGAFYIPRPHVEAQLAPHVAHAAQEYIVIVGPRGAGKSRVADAVVANKTGVLRVDMGGSQSFVEAIFSSMGGNLVSDFPERTPGELKSLFQGVAERHRQKHPAEPDWVPTLVVELRSGKKDGQALVYSVASDIKNLNSDGEWCRVILVLSDADAAFGLPRDESRQKLVWVDDFTLDQAARFLDHLGCLPLRQRFDANNTDLNEQLRHRVFEQLGTRPSTLKHFANALKGWPKASLDERVDALISKKVKDATEVLGDLFKQTASPSGAEFRSLVATMLQTPEHAVSAEPLDGNLGIAKVATKVLKEYHALMFHIPSGTYRFYSPAFLRAAREKLNKT